ncbi:unnamed protein product, partial [Heterosigma akashiwo]
GLPTGPDEPHHLDPKVAWRVKEVYAQAWLEDDGKLNLSSLLLTWCAPAGDRLP